MKLNNYLKWQKEENFKTWGTSQDIGCWCSLSELNQETY